MRKKRNAWLTALAVLGFSPMLAQVGNEWIDFSQPYFKISVAKHGIYRLTYADLVAAGMPPSVDPRTLQLYHRGKECALYVAGGDDGTLHPTDYIEFYGRAGDGSSDTDLYVSPTAQPHTHYNLFSDTTHYFLTVASHATGKRIPLLNPTTQGIQTSGFHWAEQLLVLHSEYSAGRNYGDTFLSAFDVGEGWTGPQIIQNQTGTYTLTGISGTFPSGGVPQLEVLLTGRGPMDHLADVRVNGRLLESVSFSGFESFRFIKNIEWTDIVGGSLTLSVTVKGSPDRLSVGYIRLRYPAAWSMESKPEAFFSTVSNPDPVRVEIQQAVAGTRLFDVTDPESVSEIRGAVSGTLTASIPSGSRLFYASSTFRKPLIRSVKFRSLNPAGQDYVIISHPSLRKPTTGYTDPVKAFAEYRSLPSGGGFDTLVVNIDQLYDQFNYGEQSPLAIYRFLKFLGSGQLPRFLFLIGKGLDVNYNYHRQPGVFDRYKNLVPPAGYPGSDLLFSAGLDGKANTPAIPTGRLSASTPQDVAAYLNKVKELEGQDFENLWRKNILHLSGGIFEGEPQLFRSYLASFATVAESHYLGANVTALAKQSTDIGIINVAEQINAGVGLVTFFGHSAATTTDFDIGNVTDPAMGYHNRGKYPLLFMNGCSSGAVFLNTSIFGENWVNTPDRGAIGILAHSALGFAFRLRDYSDLFYREGLGHPLRVNAAVGEIQRHVSERYLHIYGDSPGAVTQAQQMLLLGDPAVRLFSPAKPDFAIDKDLVAVSSFDGSAVTALTDSFQIRFVVKNFGKTSPENLGVRVDRILSDGSIHRYDTLFAPVLYSDTLSVRILRVENSYGNNRFVIHVDSGDMIEELREDNNEVTIDFFIPLSGTKNLYPDNFSIVGQNQVNLTFQHTDLLAGESRYLLEIDTTDLFNSPARQQVMIEGETLVVHPITLPGTDTTAWYWRTKLFNPDAGDSVVWHTSTFTLVPGGGEGWAQVHFPQLEQNSISGLVSDPELRTFGFTEAVTHIDVRVYGSLAGLPPDSARFKINGAEYNIFTDFGCRNNTLNLIAFDKTTAHAYPGIYLTWQDINFIYGGRRLICGREPYVINSFRPDELVMGNDGDLIRYIDNIPPGDSIVLFNLGDAGFSQWPVAAINKMGEIGISSEQVAGLVDGEPVIIRARKGAQAGTAVIIRANQAPAPQQGFTYTATVTGREGTGMMTSVTIGPGENWKDFYVDFDAPASGQDVRFHVDGITPGRAVVRLFSDLSSNADLSTVDAAMYPHLRIQFQATDETLVSAPQLRYWMVTYDPVPEGVLLYDGDTTPQSVNEGELWNAPYRFVNISNRVFPDSVRVDYEIVNATTFATNRRQKKISGPSPGSSTAFTLDYETRGQAGVNHISVYANPGIHNEIDLNNNIISLAQHLTVVPDDVPPVLDVTVDGRYLINGDFVSRSPKIEITVWDNNPHLLKTDTTGVLILLSMPCDVAPCPFQRINFSRPDVSWFPETDEEEFHVIFSPAALAAGTYVLRVTASDARGNPSGLAPYEVSFVVADESNVTLSGAYPNPSAVGTGFDLVVAGKHLPSVLRLRIADLTGRVVAEKNLPVENVHIGTSRVEWDGTDDNGQRVPVGIYLYQLTAISEGKMYRSEGRIVLLR